MGEYVRLPCVELTRGSVSFLSSVVVGALQVHTQDFAFCVLATFKDYDDACKRCEMWVLITAELRKKLMSILFYDKRNDGSKGRSLKFAVPSCGLLAHDRLEPFAGLPDVAQSESIELPRQLLFWRRTQETRSRRRNPILSEQLGVTPATFAEDTLHALFLGVFLEFVKFALWFLINAGVWTHVEAQNEEEILRASVMGIRSELWAWYRDFGVTNPHVDITTLSDLTAAMLGKDGERVLKTKAAETKWLIYFCRDALGKHAAKAVVLDKAMHRNLVLANTAMLLYIEILKGPRRLSPASAKELVRVRRIVWLICKFHTTN